MANPPERVHPKETREHHAMRGIPEAASKGCPRPTKQKHTNPSTYTWEGVRGQSPSGRGVGAPPPQNTTK